MNSLKKKIKDLYSFWKGIFAREISAGLSFYFITGFFSILCIVIALFGKNLHIYEFAMANLPAETGELIGNAVTAAESAVRGGGIIFVFTSLYSSLKLIYRFGRCGEILYKFQPTQRNFFKKILRYLCIIILIIIVIALCAVFFSYSLMSSEPLAEVLTYVFEIVALYLLLLAANKIICPYKLSLKEVYRGSILTLVLWIAITVITRFYFAKIANYQRVYGVLAGIFSFTLYVYFMMQGLTFGIAYNVLKLGHIKKRRLR